MGSSTIAADGSSVVNVYHDRHYWRIKFNNPNTTRTIKWGEGPNDYDPDNSIRNKTSWSKLPATVAWHGGNADSTKGYTLFLGGRNGSNTTLPTLPFPLNNQINFNRFNTTIDHFQEYDVYHELLDSEPDCENMVKLTRIGQTRRFVYSHTDDHLCTTGTSNKWGYVPVKGEYVSWCVRKSNGTVDSSGWTVGAKHEEDNNGRSQNLRRQSG